MHVGQANLNPQEIEDRRETGAIKPFVNSSNFTMILHMFINRLHIHV